MINYCDIAGIIIQQHGDTRTRTIDMRVGLWLHQWLTSDETERLIWSLSWERLVRFVYHHREAIAATKVFN